jgi:hypothetical protein
LRKKRYGTGGVARARHLKPVAIGVAEVQVFVHKLKLSHAHAAQPAIGGRQPRRRHLSTHASSQRDEVLAYTENFLALTSKQRVPQNTCTCNVQEDMVLCKPSQQD